jgi:hypothetical protein
MPGWFEKSRNAEKHRRERKGRILDLGASPSPPAEVNITILSNIYTQYLHAIFACNNLHVTTYM